MRPAEIKEAKWLGIWSHTAFREGLFILSSGPVAHARGGKPPESSPAHPEHSLCVHWGLPQPKCAGAAHCCCQWAREVTAWNKQVPHAHCSRGPGQPPTTPPATENSHSCGFLEISPLRGSWYCGWQVAAARLFVGGSREGCKQWAYHVLEYARQGGGGSGWADVLCTVISTLY